MRVLRLKTLSLTAAMRACWRWDLPKSLPPTAECRERTNLSACVAESWLGPLVKLICS